MLVLSLKIVSNQSRNTFFLRPTCKHSLSISRESSMTWSSSSGMGGRVVECARLESVYTARYRGFESPPIRQKFAQRILITILGDEEPSERALARWIILVMSPKGRGAGAGASQLSEVRAPRQRHRLRSAQPRRGVGRRPKSIPPHPPEIRADGFGA